MKNMIITGVFVSIAVTLLALGIHQIILIAEAPGTASIRVDICPLTNDHRCFWFSTVGNQAERLPPIHLQGYHLCVFTRNRKLEVAYMIILLVYGLLFSFFRDSLSQLTH